MEDSKNLLHKSVIIDAHHDLLMFVLKQRSTGKKNIIINEYIDDIRNGSINIIVSSLFVDVDYVPEKAMHNAMEQIAALYDEINESDKKIMLVRNTDDIHKAVSEKKLGIMLSFEGIEPLHNDIKMLPVFYELGVRIIGLAWSRSNSAADGCKYDDFSYEGYGLTEFGKNIVQYAEELGMIIDVTHLNEKSFWDVIKISNNPVIASHSNCRSISNTPRNLSDSQINAIADKGGVICFNSANILVSYENDIEANLSQYVKHLKHAKSITSYKNLGLGFDLCNKIIGFSNDAQALKRPIFDSFNGYSQMFDLSVEMKNQGFSDNEIIDILGNNLLNVFKKVLG